MLLSPEQLKTFDEQGYVFMPGCFSEEEIEVLRGEALAIYATTREEVWREKSGAPRTAFAAHTYNEAFAILGRDARLVRAGAAALRRAGLHAPVQDQREGAPSTASSGSGTRTTAPGPGTTACPSPGP